MNETTETDLKPASSAEIKQFWEAMGEKKATARCAVIMQQAGYKVSGSTIYRVVCDGFRPRREELNEMDKIAAKISAANRLAGHHNGTPAANKATIEAATDAIEQLDSKQKLVVREWLGKDMSEILERSRKVHLIAGMLMSEYLAEKAEMVIEAGKETAALYEAIGEQIAAKEAILPPLVEPDPPAHTNGTGNGHYNGNGQMKTIEHAALSPSGQMLADFRKKLVDA